MYKAKIFNKIRELLESPIHLHLIILQLNTYSTLQYLTRIQVVLEQFNTQQKGIDGKDDFHSFETRLGNMVKQYNGQQVG
jgi:hypothetical protein